MQLNTLAYLVTLPFNINLPSGKLILQQICEDMELYVRGEPPRYQTLYQRDHFQLPAEAADVGTV